MMKTLVIYESKYGFTKEIAQDISMVLAPSACNHVTEINKDLLKFDVIAICTPVYNDVLPQSIMDFVKSNLDSLKDKKVILFCCCLEVDYGKLHLKPLAELLGSAVIWQEIIGTKIEISHLDKNDYNNLKKVCEKDEISFSDNNLFARGKFLERLLKIRHVLDDHTDKIGNKEGFRYVEDFIKNHNTCTLATGYQHDVRATPMEYFYNKGCIYLISEGGLKFYYLLQNPNVSVAVYDNYKSFEELGGVQIQGIAEIVEAGTEEYNLVLKEKGINEELLKKCIVSLYMIRIKIKKVDFEWSGFKKLGYDIRQRFEM